MKQTQSLGARVLAVVLCIVMVLGMLPLSEVHAEPVMVAQVGDAQYATLAEAIAAVPSGAGAAKTTITLLENTSFSFDVGNSTGTAPQNVVLDLSGKKLTLVEAVGSDGTKSSGIRVLANSTLTIRNGEIVCSSEAADNIKVGIANYGTLELDNVKLYSGALTMYGINNRGDLTLKGSTEIHNGNGENFVVAVTNDPYNLVYTNRDAKFNAEAGVFVESVLVERYKRNTSNAGGVVMNITGGSYGKFLEDGADVVPVTYNVSGATIQVADGEQLRQAVAMAPASGFLTIKMTADIATSFDVGNSTGTAPQNLVLDLGGKVLTLVEAVGSNGTKSSGIRVLANSTLTVRNGEIICSSDAADNIKVGIANYGTLELDSVELRSGDLTMYGINNRGDLTLKSGTKIYNGNGENFMAAVTNDPYNLVYTNRDAKFNATEGVFVESVLVERYKRSSANAGGIVVNITGGTYGRFLEDGTDAVPVTYNVSGATIQVADGEQLRQAVAMAPANGSIAVKMTADIATSFDVGNSTGTAPQNVVLDLNGKKLALVEAVGSNGTKSSGIRVLANSGLTVHNGEIVCSSETADNIKVGIANYGTLELDSVKLYSGALTMYGINNRGALTLTGSTEIYNGTGENFVAAVTNDPYNLVYTNRNAEFNCHSSGVSVSSLLVERYARNTPNAGGVVLNITAGSFGKLVDDGATDRPADYNITGGVFGNNIDAFLNPEDYECVETDDGYVVTFIKKAQDEFSFMQAGPVEKTYEEGMTVKNEAVGGTVADASVTYAIVEDGSTPGAATVDAATGEVTVLKAGTIVIEATKAGNDTYLEATARYVLNVLPAERSASFGNTSVEVIYGTRTYVNATLSDFKQSNGTKVIYSIISGGDIATVNSETGELTFVDQKVGTVEVRALISGDDCYADCEATYKVSVSYLTLGADVNWTVTGDTGFNGWYKSTVTMTAPEGYTIGTSNSMESSDWAKSIDFTAEGTTSQNFYMKDSEGHITAAMPFEVKIDKTAPAVMIEYVEAEYTSWFDWIGGRIFGTNQQVKIVFHVDGDDIALVEWSKDDGQSYEVLLAENGEYTVNIDPEYRGHIRARVTDQAGWIVVTQEDGVLVLVDKISPNLSTNFREENGESADSFPRDDEDFMNTSAEAFYLDFVLEDNNYDLTTIVVNIDRANGTDQENVDLEWVVAEDGNSAAATLALTERDEYIITADFQDPVNKDTRTYKVRLYNSEPELKVESLSADQVANTINPVDYYQTENGVTMQLSVSDDFFAEGESGIIVNGERQVIAPENWKYNKKTDAYTTVLTYKAEGTYEVQAFYNTAWNGEKTSEAYSFVLDTTAPQTPSLVYEEINGWQKFFDNMFGFYNGDLTVSVEGVKDHLSGVSKVEFSLDGGDSYQEVIASDEGYVFTVAPEYRGQITVKVTDNAKNFVAFGESRIVVLDTTNPVIEAVEYKGKVTDRNGPLLDASSSDPNFSIVFKIVEDNLDVAPDKPKVYFKQISATEWTEAEVNYADDNHTVEFPMTVSNGVIDGTYQVKAVVKDHFSTVEETVIVKIDRTAPDIMTQMAEANNTQEGWAYYNSKEPIHMDIEIAEENFNANNVTVKVLRNGEEIASYAEDAKVNTNWMKAGQRNTTRLTFQEEGAYEVTITCTDTLGTAAKPTGIEGNALARKFVIDRTKPDASITYDEDISWIETLKGWFGFRNETITATLNADDGLAGVNTVQVSIDGENFEEVQKVDGKYSRNVEERGILTLKVMDKAGNETIVLEDRALVVDKAAPGITTAMQNDSFQQYAENGPIYTNHDPFEFTMTVEDKDTYDLFAGQAVVTDNAVDMENLVWSSNENETSGETVISVAGEGQHELTASIDTGLKEAGWKQTVIVDTTAPVIEIAVVGEKVQEYKEFDYYGTVPTVTVTINEVNFNAADVVLAMNTSKVVLGEDGNPVDLSGYAEFAKNPDNWIIEPGTNKHVLTLDVSTDAVYELTVNYMDLATNAAEAKGAKFVVDTVDPTVDTVTYSKDAVEVLLEEITFGFFQADVNVQVAASDHTAGVQSVEYWIEGTVSKDDETPVTVNGILEADENGKFEIFTLPTDFYGRVYTQAKDYSGHLSEKTNVAADADDDNSLVETVVVDADAPVLAPSLNQAANDIIDGILYYNEQYPAGLTLTVEESNFYENLFATEVAVNAKNHDGEDEDGYAIAPWSHSTTTHVQNITMTGDAEYLFTVTGEDYSGNLMESYTTPVMILDTIAPVIDVKLYAADEQGVFDTSKEAEGKIYTDDPLTYYDSAIKAVITITERNFNAEDVVITVAGTDPLGNEVTFTAAEWKSEGDVHVCEIPFMVDGTYKLDAAYTDLAKNPGNDVTEMNFDVDNANPDILVEGIVDGSFNQKTQTSTIKITDANFNPDAEHLTYNITATNSVGMELEVDFPDLHNMSNWTKTIVEDKVQWSTVLEFAVEANYTISLSYTDMSGHVGFVHDTEVATKYTVAFSVDSTVPEGLTINYSERSNEVDGIYYYKDSATLTLSTMDRTTGLEKFVLHVTPEGLTEATTIMLPNGAEVIDGSSKLAGFELVSVENANGKMVVVLNVPAQFNGKIGFTALDKAGNFLDVTDIKHNLGVDKEQVKTVVVDTIAPVLTAETAPTQILNAKTQETVELPEDGNAAYMDNAVLYYADKAVFKFTMTEANFFAGEVVFTVNDVPEVLNWIARTDEPEIYDAVWTSTEDRDYNLHLSYTDRSKNETVTYKSQRIVVDTQAPVMTVEYRDDPEIKKNTDGRDYYDADRFAVITIVDENFRSADVEILVEAKDVIGATVGKLPDEYLNRGKTQNAEKEVNEQKWSTYEGTWRRANDTYTIVIPFTTDANYTFSVSYKDLVLKEAQDFAAKAFTVDKTAPTNLTMTYAVNPIEVIKEGISFGFYDAQLDVTVTAEDATSGIDHFVYSYINREGVSSVNAELLNEALSVAKYSTDNKTETASFTIPKSALGRNNQFNGTVQFDAFDRSSNQTHHDGVMGVIVDNISPTASVSFNEPVQTVNGTEYYNGAINGRIVITEANFYSSDVEVVITRDGIRYDTRVNWSNNSVDEHVGTFTLSQEGDYTVTINYTDKSNNKMAEYKSTTKVIDLAAPVIQVSNVVADSANDMDVYTFTITVEDVDSNLRAEDIKPSLTGTFRNADGTHTNKAIELGNARVVAGGKTFTYTVQDLPEDGIYTLTCSAADLALNRSDAIILDDGTSASTVRFSINRNGSTFTYGNEATRILAENYFVQSVGHDLVIYEVNVDPINNYTVTLNGKKLTEDVDYTTTLSGGDGKWSLRAYVIHSDLFEAEGDYSVVVSSVDATNTTAYSDMKNLNMSFVVDHTEPTIIISGLQTEGRYQTESQIVTMYPGDEGGSLRSVKVELYANNATPGVDQPIDILFEMTDEKLHDYLLAQGGKIEFEVPEGYRQSVRIICEDYAVDADGNVNTYIQIMRNITVSPSGFMMFFALKHLFYGTIGGVASVLALIIFLLVKKKKDAPVA